MQAYEVLGISSALRTNSKFVTVARFGELPPARLNLYLIRIFNNKMLILLKLAQERETLR